MSTSSARLHHWQRHDINVCRTTGLHGVSATMADRTELCCPPSRIRLFKRMHMHFTVPLPWQQQTRKPTPDLAICNKEGMLPFACTAIKNDGALPGSHTRQTDMREQTSHLYVKSPKKHFLTASDVLVRFYQSNHLCQMWNMLQGCHAGLPAQQLSSVVPPDTVPEQAPERRAAQPRLPARGLESLVQHLPSPAGRSSDVHITKSTGYDNHCTVNYQNML